MCNPIINCFVLFVFFFFLSILSNKHTTTTKQDVIVLYTEKCVDYGRIIVWELGQQTATN